MKKTTLIILISFLFLGGIFVYQHSRFNDGKLHVVFCNVGQGDGIFIRTPKGKNILIDGGPDDSIISCISLFMPFWEKTIDLVILTHPHLDHFNGLRSVIKRYNILSFDTEKLSNNTEEFNQLLEDIKTRKIPTRFVYAGDSFVTREGLRLRVLAPDADFINRTSPFGTIGENKEFASIISLISYGSFNILLTGDSQKEGLLEAINNFNLQDIDILQIPHHGSKTGLSKEILDKLDPKTAVISVGKNRYGHPTSYVLDLLEEFGVKIIRTDIKGNVEIISDANSWIMKLN